MNKILNALQFATVRKGSSSPPKSVSPDDVVEEARRSREQRQSLLSE